MTTFPQSTPPPPGQPAQPQQSSGCWKWGACGCIAALVIVVVGIAGIAAIVFGIIMHTEAYRGALRTAERDPRVIAAIGEPMHAGFWVTGSVHAGNNGEGQADIRFPLIGPKGRGTVHAVGTLAGQSWHYSELAFTPRDGNAIDLLTP